MLVIKTGHVGAGIRFRHDRGLLSDVIEHCPKTKYTDKCYAYPLINYLFGVSSTKERIVYCHRSLIICNTVRQYYFHGQSPLIIAFTLAPPRLTRVMSLSILDLMSPRTPSRTSSMAAYKSDFSELA